MSSILQGLTSMITPELAEKLSKILGGKSDVVLKGLKLLGPMVVAALGKKAASPEGPAAVSGLLGLLPSDADDTDGLLAQLVSSDLGSQLVDGLLGDKASALTNSLARSSRVPGLRGLFELAAPLGLAQVATAMKEQELDAGSLAATLTAEADALAGSDDESAVAVLTAFKDAEAQAELKATVGEDSWAALSAAPLLAAGYVSAASKGGLFADPLGSFKEMEALVSAFDPAGLASGSTLVDGVVTSIQDAIQKAKTGQPPWDLSDVDLDDRSQVKTAVLDKLKLATDTLAAFPAADQASYKQLIVDAATKVAEAGKEGGFLGLGGKKVSDDEAHALWNIKAALGF